VETGTRCTILAQPPIEFLPLGGVDCGRVARAGFKAVLGGIEPQELRHAAIDGPAKGRNDHPPVRTLEGITVRPCMALSMLCTILGGGRTSVPSSSWNFSQPIALLLLRRLSQYRHAFSAARRTSSSRRRFPWIP